MKDELKLRIVEAVKMNREIIRNLLLQNQSLMAQLPSTGGGRSDKTKGFIELPDGEKLWFDKAAEKRHAKAQRGLKMMAGGKL